MRDAKPPFPDRPAILIWTDTEFDARATRSNANIIQVVKFPVKDHIGDIADQPVAFQISELSGSDRMVASDTLRVATMCSL